MAASCRWTSASTLVLLGGEERERGTELDMEIIKAGKRNEREERWAGAKERCARVLSGRQHGQGSQERRNGRYLRPGPRAGRGLGLGEPGKARGRIEGERAPSSAWLAMACAGLTVALVPAGCSLEVCSPLPSRFDKLTCWC